jgi:alginate O-acetyltransferase complex protein AlgI
MIHYVVEVYRNKAPAGSFVDFANYVLFFPTFLAGPVERFPKFHAQTTDKGAFNLSLFNDGLLRILSGIGKKFIVADYLRGLVMPMLSSPEDHGRYLIILAVYGLAIQIYMDFSGYTDMALGVARLFGYKIMENFNYPYFKKNIALFWRNWHISVYSFIRDYFFFPLFGYKASTIKIYLGVFCTMLVFMLWHEGSLNFFLLGVYHGLGLVVWNLYQELKRKYAFLRRKKESQPGRWVSTFVTFTFVSFGFVIFMFDIRAIGRILNQIF